MAGWKRNRKDLSEWHCGELHCLAPSPLHLFVCLFWTRNLESILDPKFTRLGFRCNKSPTTAEEARAGCITVSGADPLHSPDNVKPSLVLCHPPPHAEALCGKNILSGICGSMSAGACIQMATGQCRSCFMKVILPLFQDICSWEGCFRRLQLRRVPSSSLEPVGSKTTPRGLSQTHLSPEPPRGIFTVRLLVKDATP